jgi:CheY-like chemotaxis protein
MAATGQRRPPPTVLFVRDGTPFEAHIKHLRDARLRVTEVHADEALTTAGRLQPDIVVLNFTCNGDLTEQFKENRETGHIPVIALVKMLQP